MVGGRPRFFSPIILIFLAFTVRSQNFDAPARAMARKITSAINTREPATFSFRSAGAVSPSDADAARESLQRELPGAGVSAVPQADVSVVVTLSDNLRGWVWVADIRKGDSREVVMEEWPKVQEAAGTGSVVVEARRVFDQEQRILDFAPFHLGLLVLDAEAVSVYENSGGAWRRKLSARIPVARAWPRDLRGRLFVQGDVYEAYLPGVTCTGSAASGLSITCRDEGLWPLEPTAHGVSIPARNFFEIFVLPDGLQKRVPPFFSVAALAGRGRAAWIFGATDGRTHVYNAMFEPGVSWSGWGSDVAVAESECGSRTLLLATGSGDDTAPDFVQAYEMTAAAAHPVGDPVSFPGPVTALWAASERGTVMAVSRDLKSGRYAAFRLSIPCSR
jgi:hypothetical protein